MLNTIRNIALLFAFSFFLFSANVSAQVSADACSINRLNLANIGSLFRSALFGPNKTKYTPDMKIIVIASLGAKETDRKYNTQRLEEVRRFFDMEHGIRDDQMILAQGEKKNDKGELHIFYGGILQSYITFKPKQKLILKEGKDPCTY